jgi:serine/threonine protein kinase
LYSFGATLYQLAVGQTPFTGETVEELIRKHLRSAAVPLRELNPNVPLPLERVVLNLLSKDPAHRYPSAKMVLSALEGIDVWPNSAQGDDHEALARKKRA